MTGTAETGTAETGTVITGGGNGRRELAQS
jgi:hypothetical protein